MSRNNLILMWLIQVDREIGSKLYVMVVCPPYWLCYISSRQDAGNTQSISPHGMGEYNIRTFYFAFASYRNDFSIILSQKGSYFISLLSLCFRISWLSMALLGSLSCSSGDTLASELGSVLSRSDPWLITSFRRVPKGNIFWYEYFTLEYLF